MSLALEVRCDWPQGRYPSPSLREVVHLPALFGPHACGDAECMCAMASGWCRKMRVKDEKRRICGRQIHALEFPESLQEMISES